MARELGGTDIPKRRETGTQRRPPEPGVRVTLEEIQAVLTDEGYSADQRKGWLKQLLTDITSASSSLPSRERKELIESVKEVIKKYQSKKPIADDLL